MRKTSRFLSNVVFLLIAGTLQAAEKTGESFSYKPSAADGEEMVWYLVDWGDGTWSPTSHGLAQFSPRFSKVWKNVGRFMGPSGNFRSGIVDCVQPQQLRPDLIILPDAASAGLWR